MRGDLRRIKLFAELAGEFLHVEGELLFLENHNREREEK